MAERVCKICGATFVPKVPSQLCCSKECSKENNRRLNNKHKKKDQKAEKPKDIPYRERPGVCDRFCDGCIYKGIVEANLRCCHYFLSTGKLRPCPAGNGCTVKKTVTKKEREEARAKRHREWIVPFVAVTPAWWTVGEKQIA